MFCKLDLQCLQKPHELTWVGNAALGEAVPGAAQQENPVFAPNPGLMVGAGMQQTVNLPPRVNEAFQPLSSNLRNGPTAKALKVLP